MMFEKEWKDINVKGIGEHTPWHFTCESGSIEVVKYLIEHGSDKDINAKDKDEKTPLHIACEKN